MLQKNEKPSPADAGSGLHQTGQPLAGFTGFLYLNPELTDVHFPLGKEKWASVYLFVTLPHPTTAHSTRKIMKNTKYAHSNPRRKFPAEKQPHPFESEQDYIRLRDTFGLTYTEALVLTLLFRRAGKSKNRTAVRIVDIAGGTKRYPEEVSDALRSLIRARLLIRHPRPDDYTPYSYSLPQHVLAVLHPNQKQKKR